MECSVGILIDLTYLHISFRAMDSALSESPSVWWKQLGSWFFIFSVDKLVLISFSFIDSMIEITPGMVFFFFDEIL